MRFDLLDEYSTLVPFGHVSKHKRVVQSPGTATKVAKPSAIANCVSCLKIFCKFVKAAGSSWRARSAKRALVSSRSHPSSDM